MNKAAVPSSACPGKATVNPVRGQKRVQRFLPASTQASRGYRTQQVQCDLSARGPPKREPSVSSFLSLSVLSPVGLHHLRAQPSAPCDLLHSGKEMEVIHSGNCDCLFPGRRCSWEVPAAFPPGEPRPLPLASQGVPGRV